MMATGIAAVWKSEKQVWTLMRWWMGSQCKLVIPYPAVPVAMYLFGLNFQIEL